MTSILKSSNPEKRRQLAAALKGVNTADALHSLFVLLGDKDWRVRKTAVESVLARQDIHDILGKIIDLLSSEDNAGLRNSASELLYLVGTPSIAPLTAKLSATEDADAIIAILNLLGELHECDDIDSIIRLSSDKNKNVAAAAISCLGNLGQRSVSDVLMKFLDGRDSWLSFHAIEALGKLGESRAVPRLQEFYLAGKLRRCVLDAFSEIGSKEIVEFLMEQLSHTEKIDWDLLECIHKIHSETMAAGSTMTDSEMIEKLFSKNFPKQLVEPLFKESFNRPLKSRHITLEMLSWIDSSQTASFLLSALSDMELCRVAKKSLLRHSKAAQALSEAINRPVDDLHLIQMIDIIGELREKGTTSLILPFADSENSEIRLSTVGALAKIATEEGFETLLKRIKDPVSEIQKEASEGIRNILCKIGNHTHYVPQLKALIKSDSPTIRRGIILILAGVEGIDAKEELILAAKDESPEVRKTAIKLMGEIGDNTFTGSVTAALSDESSNVREVAVKAISRMNIPDAHRLLVALLDDDDMWVRAESAELIGKLAVSCNDVEKRLYETFLNDVPLVKIAAIKSIGKNGGEKAVQIMEEALQNEDEEICLAAVEALSSIGNNESVKILIKLTENNNLKIASAALWALKDCGENEKVESVLIAHLQSNNNTDTTGMAIKVLTVLKSTKAIAPAIVLLKKGLFRKELEEYFTAIGKININLLKNEVSHHDHRAIRSLVDIINFLEGSPVK